MLTWLAPLFAITAVVYASVGFAGGSTYTALLVLAGVSLALVPMISLSCNIVVAIGGVIRFAAAGHIPWRRVAPLLALSVPLAWVGGRMSVDPELFVALLGGSLAIAGVLLLFGRDRASTRAPVDPRSGPGLAALAVAAPLGLLSGLVGIGGGIFLAPVLHLMAWDSARRIAGTAALFILVNSLAGIVGQIAKLGDTVLVGQAIGWWPLVVAVLIGGQVGSLLGVRHFPQGVIRRVTGAVILIAAARLLFA